VGFVFPPSAPAPPFGDVLQERLQDMADQYVKTRGPVEKISGMALRVDLVGHDLIDVYAGTTGAGTDGAGTDGRGGGTPINAETLFQIGSNTKHFTAALVLKLEAEGKLNIEQTVGDWLPQYPDWAHVSIRSLLNMTSDIPNYSEAVPIAQTLSADMHHQFSYDALIAAVYGQGLPVPTGYFYSNTNDIIAAKIIEAAGHKPFGDALDEMIGKLDLRNTFYEDGPYPRQVLQRLPVGLYDNHDCTIYQPKPCGQTAWAGLVGKDVSSMNMSWAGPAGGMISNTRDLATWVRALFGGRVIPKQQLDEMMTMVSTRTGKPIADVSTDDPRGFGLDLGRGYQAGLGGAYWYYQGTTFGFRAIFAYWPQYDLVITAMTNSQPEDAEDKFAATVVGGAFQLLRQAGLVH
jgi:D-alanyl-D-alanine carboxypeptidase